MLRTALLFAHQRDAQAEFVKLLYKKPKPNHTTSVGRADVVSAILSTPQADLHNAVLRATRMHELDRDSMIRLLQKLRTFRRLDMAEVAVKAYREGGRALSPHHFSLLMTQANEAGAWMKSLQYWNEAVQQSRVSPVTHSVLLQTLKTAGRWREAIAHAQSMYKDHIPVDVHALHTLMNAARTSAPWHVSIALFSQGIQSGTTPNALVYLVLLRCLTHSRFPHKWYYSLSILNQLESKFPRSAGMYNAVMETLTVCGRWNQAVMLFHQMKDDQVLPSKDTMRVLMQCHEQDVAHCVRTLAATNASGMPMTEEMWRMLFRSLLCSGRAAQVQALIESHMLRATTDTANPNMETLPLFVALFDCILDHGNAKDVDMLMSSFGHNIETVVSQATAGLGSMGEPSQRWIIEGGRVAVVDAFALRSKHLASLHAHYDYVLVPISVIRSLVLRSEGVGRGGAQERFNKWLLHWLRRQLNKASGVGSSDDNSSSRRGWEIAASEWLKVMPLQHELFAHRHLLPRFGEDPAVKQQELTQLRKSAADVAAELLLSESVSRSPDRSLETYSSFVIRSEHAEGGQQLLSNELSLRPGGTAVARVQSKPPREQEEVEEPVCEFLRQKSWLTQGEKCVSVAVMLKRLNPHVSIHVVSTQPFVMEAVKAWNAHSVKYHPSAPCVLTDVLLAAELHQKAPPVRKVGVQSGSNTLSPASGMDSRRNDTVAADQERTFVDVVIS